METNRGRPDINLWPPWSSAGLCGHRRRRVGARYPVVERARERLYNGAAGASRTNQAEELSVGAGVDAEGDDVLEVGADRRREILGHGHKGGK
jgi:hypothetical protein